MDSSTTPTRRLFSRRVAVAIVGAAALLGVASWLVFREDSESTFVPAPDLSIWLAVSPDGRRFLGETFAVPEDLFATWRVKPNTADQLFVSSEQRAGESLSAGRFVNVDPAVGRALIAKDASTDLGEPSIVWGLVKALHGVSHLRTVAALVVLIDRVDREDRRIPKEWGEWLLTVEPWQPRGTSSELDRVSVVWEVVSRSGAEVPRKRLEAEILHASALLDADGFHDEDFGFLMDEVNEVRAANGDDVGRPIPPAAWDEMDEDARESWLKQLKEYEQRKLARGKERLRVLPFLTKLTGLGAMAEICRSQYPSAAWWKSNSRLVRALELRDAHRKRVAAHRQKNE